MKRSVYTPSPTPKTPEQQPPRRRFRRLFQEENEEEEEPAEPMEMTPANVVQHEYDTYRVVAPPNNATVAEIKQHEEPVLYINIEQPSRENPEYWLSYKWQNISSQELVNAPALPLYCKTAPEPEQYPAEYVVPDLKASKHTGIILKIVSSEETEVAYPIIFSTNGQPLSFDDEFTGEFLHAIPCQWFDEYAKSRLTLGTIMFEPMIETPYMDNVNVNVLNFTFSIYLRDFRNINRSEYDRQPGRVYLVEWNRLTSRNLFGRFNV
jgi:hypothetical protein